MPESGALSVKAWQVKARALQIAWRESHHWDRGFAQPTYEPADDPTKSVPCDWCLTPEDDEFGHNFLTPTIHAAVERALTTAEPDSLIRVARLRRNMLSSQPLAFNAFGELSVPGREERATDVLRRLWPDLVGRVRSIRYEHNPNRGPFGLIGTMSAFDVFIEVDLPGGAGLGFIGVEVKYHEDMKGKPLELTMMDPVKSEARRQRLDAAAGWVGSSVEEIRDAGIDQVWLDHALALAMLNPSVQRAHREHNGVPCLPAYSRGLFVVLYPSENPAVPRADDTYRRLTSLSPETRESIATLTLEEYAEACSACGEGWPADLRNRYLAA